MQTKNLTTKIDKFYLDNNTTRERDHFYVSDAGKCPRQLFYAFKGAEKSEMEARMLRVFEIGDTLHNGIFSILYRMGIEAITEVAIPANGLISGRADAIFVLDGEKYVMDIKSMNSFIFKGLKEPKEENVNQVQLYLHFFGVEKGMLLYVDKDRQDLKEFTIDYDPFVAETILNEFTELQKDITADKCPGVLENPDWRCRYCQYADHCKKMLVVEQ